MLETRKADDQEGGLCEWGNGDVVFIFFNRGLGALKAAYLQLSCPWATAYDLESWPHRG